MSVQSTYILANAKHTLSSPTCPIYDQNRLSVSGRLTHMFYLSFPGYFQDKREWKEEVLGNPFSTARASFICLFCGPKTQSWSSVRGITLLLYSFHISGVYDAVFSLLILLLQLVALKIINETRKHLSGINMSHIK